MAGNRWGGSRRRTPFVFALIAGGLASALLSGCGRQPQMQLKNLRLAESLRTAISAKRTDWLEQNAKLFDERHKSGELSDTEYQALEAILNTAQQGDWATAQTQIIRLEKAQRPPSR